MTRSNSLAVDSAADDTPRPLASWYAEGASDGVGDRLLMFDNSGTPSLELLRFRRELASAPGFEDALRARVDRLHTFDHPAFSKARAVEHLDAGGALTLVSTYTPGKRLADIFRSPRGRAGVHPAFAAWLIRDLTTALADLQRQGPAMMHGAVSADRIVLTGDGRLMIVEHVIGGALDRLRLPAARLWAEFDLIAPEAYDGTALLDKRSDVIQLAWMVLSVLLGRRLTPAEYPYAAELFDEFARNSGRRSPAMVPALRCWLERALRSDGQGFESAAHAQDALRELSIHAAPHAIEPLPPAEPAEGDRTPPAASVPALSAPHAVDTAPRITARVISNQEPPIDSEPDAPSIAELRHERRPELRLELRLDHTPAVEAEPPAAESRVTLGWLAAAVFAVCAVVEAGMMARMANKTQPPAATVVPVTFESQTPGDAVIVDGQQVGVTPLALNLSPVVRSVRIEPQSHVVQAAPQAPGVVPAIDRRVEADGVAQAAARERRAGLRISSPIELQVLEGERVLGSSAGPITIAAGRHELDFVNTAAGYRSREIVDVKPGQVLRMSVVPPDGRVSVNAIPWAQVFINGSLVGETPIANLPLAAGEHQITFRHPQLGEQTQRVMVRAAALTRVSATFAR